MVAGDAALCRRVVKAPRLVFFYEVFCFQVFDAMIALVGFYFLHRPVFFCSASSSVISGIILL